MHEMASVGEITAFLRDHCTVPLQLRIEDGCLAASSFAWGGSKDLAITFEHPEGSFCLGVDLPTHAQHYDVPMHSLTGVYAEDREIVMAALEEWGLGETPWVEGEHDATGREATQAHENMEVWLNENIDWGEADGIGTEVNQFAPGFAIFEELSEAERTLFGLRPVDRGGPASSVPAVTFRGDVTEFNAFLAQEGLPYRLEQES